jgi:hypothetical protein
MAPLLRAWGRQGIPGQVIGWVERGHGVQAKRNGRPASFPWIARDEIIQALGGLHGDGRRRPPD